MKVTVKMKRRMKIMTVPDDYIARVYPKDDSSAAWDSDIEQETPKKDPPY